MPRVGSSALDHCGLHQAGPVRPIHQAHGEVLAFAKMQRDVARLLTQPETILATNTSSLSVTEISVASGRPARVVGMHFFNPAPVLKPLVEVIGTVVTDEAVLRDVEDFACRAWARSPSSSGTRPASSPTRCSSGTSTTWRRCTRPSTRAAKTSTPRCGWVADCPWGRFRFLDLIGLDTAYEILDTMYRQSRDPGSTPRAPILKQMVTAGLNGRKTGRGFYSYEGPVTRRS